MMKKISLETSLKDIELLHSLIEKDGRKKNITVPKAALSRLLVDHTRMCSSLGSVVE